VSGYALVEPASRAAVERLWAVAATLGMTRSYDAGSASFVGALALDNADVLFANLDEGRVLTSAHGAEDVARGLAGRARVVALKLGARGAIAADVTGVTSVEPPATEVTDPTGAGDAFCAGFLAAWLGGAPPTAALVTATDAAGQALQVVGGRPPAPKDDWVRLREAARAVAADAFAPWSGLRVGAAGLTDDGRVVTGCNVENASYGLTLCAECGLVSALHAAGARRVVRLSVVTADGVALAPCGRCRQVLLDNGGPAMLVDRGPGEHALSLGDLLPHAFDASVLTRGTER